MKLRLYNEQDGVTKLGPGVRYVIWTQGCPRRCPGCMTPNSREMAAGYPADVRKLAEKIAGSEREGITISGGEPFVQAEALTELISEVRKVRDLGVIIYTGYTLEELKTSKDLHVEKLLQQCDLLIDGAYVEELNDGKNLRGSSNQQVIPLSKRYEDSVSLYGSKPAEVEFFVKEDRLSMVGIPTSEMLERLKNISF